VPLREERAQRIVKAILENIEHWEHQVLTIEARALPGNKADLLALARDMEIARRSICRLAGLEGFISCPSDEKLPET